RACRSLSGVPRRSDEPSRPRPSSWVGPGRTAGQPPEEARMATFLTIGYGDRAGYERTDAEVRDAAHAHDARLRDEGALMGIAGSPVQVRNHDAAAVGTTDGPFMSSELPVAG